MDGFKFEGVIQRIIDSGDGDFLTEDTLWDLKFQNNYHRKTVRFN